MKKISIRIMMFTIFLTCLTCVAYPKRVEAAAARLNKTSVMMLKGGTTSIRLSKYPKKTKKFVWKVSGKAAKITRRKKNLEKSRL